MTGNFESIDDDDDDDEDVKVGAKSFLRKTTIFNGAIMENRHAV
jgi:hypothetical protein